MKEQKYIVKKLKGELTSEDKSYDINKAYMDLKEYLEIAGEVDRLSIEREPGVICLYPMQSAEDPCRIRILEIYATEEVYQAHLKTDYFQKYKQGTLHMVKDLKLPLMQPLDLETMKQIFRKHR